MSGPQNNGYPKTIKDIYPEDTRFGFAYLRPPLDGVVTPAYEADLDQQQAEARETIRFFEEKYPDFRWWESTFVEEKPAVSLLMQSVNDRLGFASNFSLHEVFGIVEKLGGVETALVQNGAEAETEYDDVYAARLATRVLQATPDGRLLLEEAKQHMTDEDLEQLWQLEYGMSRGTSQEHDD